MSIQINTAFVQQYKANVTLLVQQKGSRLRDTVVNDMQVGETAFVEQIGATDANDVVERHGDTPINNTPHSRRMLTLVTKDWGDLVDRADKVRLLIDPTSPYAVNASYAMGRAMDDAIIAAATGSAFTGKAGATVVPLPSAQKIAVATSGLTLAKLLTAREILNKADVDPDEPQFAVLTAAQLTTLLNTTEVKSADFNTVKALVEGKIDSFLGFTFRRTQRLTKVSTTRTCIAYARSGIQLNIGQEPFAQIAQRPDKKFSVQVYYAMDIGAARLEETKVVQIDALES